MRCPNPECGEPQTPGGRRRFDMVEGHGFGVCSCGQDFLIVSVRSGLDIVIGLTVEEAKEFRGPLAHDLPAIMRKLGWLEAS